MIDFKFELLRVYRDKCILQHNKNVLCSDCPLTPNICIELHHTFPELNIFNDPKRNKALDDKTLKEGLQMAIKKNKEQENMQALDIKVTRAKDFSKDKNTSITFDVVINGVTIYGCWYREGTNKNKEEYAMVSFPSHEGKDGKYYSHAYVKLSNADVQNIAEQIEKLL